MCVTPRPSTRPLFLVNPVHITPEALQNLRDVPLFSFIFLSAAHAGDPDEASNTIRLLTLMPDKPGASISCSLAIKSLAELPDYEALSYVWETSISLTQSSSTVASSSYNKA